MKPGIYQISMADYLADPALSQSGMKWFARSPAHYRQYRDYPPESTPDQIMGTITHTLVFEPENRESCWAKPTTYVNEKGEEKKWNGNAKQCKEWIATHSDRPIISQDSLCYVVGMQQSVMANPAVRLALKNSKAEQSCFCIDETTGVPLKARLDCIAGNALIDLKKCRDASPQGFSKAIGNFGYDVQAAVHLFVARECGIPAEHFLFVAVEDEPPYAVGMYELDSASLGFGHSKFRRILSRYNDCLRKDEWPAYSKNIEFISSPKWAQTNELRAMELEDSPAMPALEVA